LAAAAGDEEVAAALSFDEGGVVPFTGLHLVHEGERVLNVKQRADYESMMAGLRAPAPFAERGEGGTGIAQPHTSGSPSSNFTLHYHSGNVSALDRSGVDSVLQKSKGELIRLVREGVRRGSISPREISRRV
jgi:hypothetical protein